MCAHAPLAFFYIEMKLIKLEGAKRALAEARTLDEIQHIMDNAVAFQVYAKAAKMGIDMQNDCAEIKIRAERKAGAFLRQIEKQKPGEHWKKRLQDETVTPKLSDLGIEKTQSHRWQQISTVPVETFENHIQETRDKHQELTSASILRLAQAEKRRQRHEDVKDVELSGKRYRVFYCDPPWRYNDSGVITENDNYGRAERHYPTMSMSQLRELSINEIADDNAILFMWCTSPMLESAFTLVESWGFRYKTSFVWDKVKHNFGHYNSVRHEFLLVCTKGSCTPDNLKLFDSVQQIKRSKVHSQKPEEFREIIDTLYTWGNKIELFARKRTSGWDVWGNQISEMTNS